MKTRVLARSFTRGFLYSIIVVPFLLPLLLIILAKEEGGGGGEDWQVSITKDALEDEYSRFYPRRVFHIGLYIDDISNIQVGERLFHSRFIYWGKNFFNKSSNDRSLISEDEFRVVNTGDLKVEMRALREVEGGHFPKTVAHVSYQADGEIKNEFYLAQYPFDVHTLRWIVEPKNFGAEEMILSVDANSTLHGGIDLGEWNVRSFSAYSEIHEAKSDFSDPELVKKGTLWNLVPRAVFEVKIRRQLLSHLLKELLPLLVILMVGYSNFYVDPSLFEARSGVGITGILAVVALHWSASSELPGVAYLTAMDQFFLVGYSLVLLVALEAVVSLLLSPTEGQRSDHPWFRFVMPCLRIGYPLFLVVSWYLISLKALNEVMH